jgi:hypothetical protein
MQDQSQALGGWKKFTSRGGGCHPEFACLSWIDRDDGPGSGGMRSHPRS